MKAKEWTIHPWTHWNGNYNIFNHIHMKVISLIDCVAEYDWNVNVYEATSIIDNHRRAISLFYHEESFGMTLMAVSTLVRNEWKSYNELSIQQLIEILITIFSNIYTWRKNSPLDYVAEYDWNVNLYQATFIIDNHRKSIILFQREKSCGINGRRNMNYQSSSM